MEHQSKYDPTRKTVGAIYRDLQIKGHDPVQVGDMNHELISSLISDLNDELAEFKTTPYYSMFENKAYYLTIHEKRDLVMPNAFLRRMIHTLYRPWPEDDTLVFWRSADRSVIKFCWSLPHWTEMNNMLAAEELFKESHKEQLVQIKAWRRMDLYHFGFRKNDVGNWEANPNFKDQPMESTYSSSIKILTP